MEIELPSPEPCPEGFVDISTLMAVVTEGGLDA